MTPSRRLTPAAEIKVFSARFRSMREMPSGLSNMRVFGWKFPAGKDEVYLGMSRDLLQDIQAVAENRQRSVDGELAGNRFGGGAGVYNEDVARIDQIRGGAVLDITLDEAAHAAVSRASYTAGSSRDPMRLRVRVVFELEDEGWGAISPEDG